MFPTAWVHHQSSCIACVLLDLTLPIFSSPIQRLLGLPPLDTLNPLESLSILSSSPGGPEHPSYEKLSTD